MVCSPFEKNHLIASTSQCSFSLGEKVLSFNFRKVLTQKIMS